MSEVTENSPVKCGSGEPKVDVGPPVVAPLGNKAATGFAWGMVIMVVSKLSTILTNLVLTYLLSPEDFGLVGMAYTVATFAFLIQGGGLWPLMTQRQHKLNRMANPAFWLSLTQGILGSLVMIGGGFIAAASYHQPRVIGLLLVMAIVPIINSLYVVAMARMTSQLRFREMSLTTTVTAILSMIVSVVAASPWLHLGAYSFVIPFPISAAIFLVVYTRLTKTKLPHWRLDLARWGALLKDSLLILGSSLCCNVIYQGDYVILSWVEGRRFSTEEAQYQVGLYFFAFMLSMQIISILAANLTNILFPTLSKIQHDPIRQRNAFLRATRAMGLVMIPGALFMMVASDSIIRGFFSHKWEAAIPLAQILSFGMVLRTISWASGTLLMAQGRFKTMLCWYGCTAPIYLSVVFVGVYLGDCLGAAIAEAVYFFLVDPWFIYVAIRPSGGRVIDVWRCIRLPLLGGVIVTEWAVLVGELFPAQLWHRDIFRLIGMGLVSLGVYLVILRVGMPQEFLQNWARIQKLLAQHIWSKASRLVGR